MYITKIYKYLVWVNEWIKPRFTEYELNALTIPQMHFPILTNLKDKIFIRLIAVFLFENRRHASIVSKYHSKIE